MNRIALYHLESLLWIARLGTFRAAAERLNITQPTISARMRELEASLGFPLFRREGRHMVLTLRGRQVVTDTKPLWAALERALSESGEGMLRGTLRIATGEIAAATCLPRFMADAERLFPATIFALSIRLTGEMLQDLLAGTSDIALLAGPVASPGLVTRAIGEVELLWLANPATAARMRQAGTEAPAIWSLPAGSPIHQVMLATHADTSRYGPRIHTCDNVRTLIDIVAEGDGIALIPADLARSHLASGRLVEIRERPSRRIIFEAAIRAQEDDRLVLAVFDQLCASARISDVAPNPALTPS